jgi:hypothetical protein
MEDFNNAVEDSNLCEQLLHDFDLLCDELETLYGLMSTVIKDAALLEGLRGPSEGRMPSPLSHRFPCTLQRVQTAPVALSRIFHRVLGNSSTTSHLIGEDLIEDGLGKTTLRFPMRSRSSPPF